MIVAWYYMIKDKEFGPMNVESLRYDILAENVKPTDMVKGPGVEVWTPVADVMNIINNSPDTPVAVSVETSGSSEGDTASFIGNAIIWLSLISAVICIFALGRTEVSNGFYNTTQWNSLLITMFIAGGLNGVLFGYLLAKVGSVLKRLERAQKSI